MQWTILTNCLAGPLKRKINKLRLLCKAVILEAHYQWLCYSAISENQKCHCQDFGPEHTAKYLRMSDPVEE